MEKGLILCDTNIIIEFYKGNDEIVEKLKGIGIEKIAISAITLGELIFGALNNKELSSILKDSKSLNIIPINQSISNRFLGLMQKFSLSHKLAIPDALIAATAIENNFEFFTLNVKDFRFIKDLRLFEV